MNSVTDKAMTELTHHMNAYPDRDLAIGRWPHGFGGFLVFVRGEVLRRKKFGKPHNERVFASQDAALQAGRRARR